MKTARQPSLEEWGILLALAGTLFGAWMRLEPPLLAGFPVNDGGLFHQVIEAVRAGGFQTSYIPYNGMQIPFAYPALGFFLSAWAADVFHISTLALLRWLPAGITVLTIPAVFVFGRKVLGSGFQAGLATYFYAFMPRAYAWLIMGGGLTRSLGQLFLILAGYFLFQMFTDRTPKRLILSIVFSALVVLSHPEAAIHTAGLGILLWVIFGRNKQGTRDAVLVGFGVLALSAIWWLPAVVRFGPGPLLSAASTGQHSPFSILKPLIANITGEQLTTYGAVFAMLGAILQVSRGNYFLTGWLIAAFVIEPRNAWTVAMVPAACLAGFAVHEILLKPVPGLAHTPAGGSTQPPPKTFPILAFLIFIALYMLGGARQTGERLLRMTATTEDLTAFEWIRVNTPADARFALITGNPDLFGDGAQEWFPALTGRVSVTTLQGREWLDGRNFTGLVADFQAFQDCAYSASPDGCIEDQALHSNLVFEYIYITPVQTEFRAEGEALAYRLVETFKINPGYRLVYEAGPIAVFSRLSAAPLSSSPSNGHLLETSNSRQRDGVQ